MKRTFFSDSSDTLYDVPTGMIVLLSFLYGSISVLAVVGNLLVMWVVATSRRMQSVTNCYIANLALADIVIGLFAVPFQVSAYLKWLSLWYFLEVTYYVIAVPSCIATTMAAAILYVRLLSIRSGTQCERQCVYSYGHRCWSTSGYN